MFNLFAHSEELHGEHTNDLEHLLTQSFVALPLFAALLIIMYFFSKDILKWPLHRTMLAYMAVFFVTGVGFYTLVPAISLVSLTLGILLALFFALTSIAK